MSDKLYRAGLSSFRRTYFNPTGDKDIELAGLLDDGILVKVEPVVITVVDGPFFVEEYGDLPFGRYAIVRLEDDDE